MGDGGKALTIRQPWASAILHGLKRIETRSWRTHYRGRIWIHAGAHTSAPAPVGFRTNVASWRPMPLGAIIASARLAGCFRVEELLELGAAWGERQWGDFTPGRWGWVLEDVRPVKPRYVRGAQGLWTPRPR